MNKTPITATRVHRGDTESTIHVIKEAKRLLAWTHQRTMEAAVSGGIYNNHLPGLEKAGEMAATVLALQLVELQLKALGSQLRPIGTMSVADLLQRSSVDNRRALRAMGVKASDSDLVVDLAALVGELLALNGKLRQALIARRRRGR